MFGFDQYYETLYMWVVSFNLIQILLKLAYIWLDKVLINGTSLRIISWEVNPVWFKMLNGIQITLCCFDKKPHFGIVGIHII